jgi:hypothetical protein
MAIGRILLRSSKVAGSVGRKKYMNFIGVSFGNHLFAKPYLDFRQSENACVS